MPPQNADLHDADQIVELNDGAQNAELQDADQKVELHDAAQKAWAAAADGDGWWSRAGPCPGAQTIGRAELAAVCHVLCSATPGVIVTDCLGIRKKARRIMAGLISQEQLLKSTNADLWSLAWDPLRSGLGWEVEWVPSHHSCTEAAAAGVSHEDWLGNDKADQAAKVQAHVADASPALLQKWAEHQAATEAVWRLIAESQVAHLAGRPRRRDGTAVKSRKRKAPARPNRNGRRKVGPAVARLPQSAAAPAAPAAAAGGVAFAAAAAAAGADAGIAPPQGPAPGPVLQAAAAFDWPAIPAVPGLHHLLPEAVPAGQRSWTKSTAGSLSCKWSCGACSKTATNNSRLFELLRTPCGEQPGEWRQLMHAAAVQGDKVACTRCGTTKQPHIQLQLQKCPVRGYFRGGVEDPAATGVCAAWQRTVRAMHAFAKAATAVPEETLGAADTGPAEAQAVGAAAELPEVEPVAVPVPLVLRPFRSHVVAKVAEVEFCMQCCMRTPRYQPAVWRAGCCDGRTPIGACPRYILAAITTSTAKWPTGHEVRGHELAEAARAFMCSLTAKALRPPKRRQARPQAGQGDSHRRA